MLCEAGCEVLQQGHIFCSTLLVTKHVGQSHVLAFFLNTSERRGAEEMEEVTVTGSFSVAECDSTVVLFDDIVTEEEDVDSVELLAGKPDDLSVAMVSLPGFCGMGVAQHGHMSWLALLETMHVGQFHEPASCLNKSIRDDDVVVVLEQSVFTELDSSGFLVLQQGHTT